MQVGIVGGTGPAGRGLTVRLSAAGVTVVVGSRESARGEQVAAELRDRWGARLSGALEGGDNDLAAACDLVVVATPWEGAVPTVRSLAPALERKVVVSMGNALVKEGKEMLALVHPRGSVAAALQAALPRSEVAAAFHHLPASEMENLDSGLEADVLVCSDHPGATAATVELVDLISGLRPVDAGSLAQAAAIEAFTAVCITVNIRHRAHTTVRLAGL
jgi:NADPH-dependent F420 reductase